MTVRIGGPTEVTDSGFALPIYDYVVNTTPADPVVETYVFHLHGSSGPQVATVTVTYTDSSKATLLTAVKTVP